jgi:hypothetical protein
MSFFSDSRAMFLFYLPPGILTLFSKLLKNEMEKS